MLNAGQIVTRAMLLEKVWGFHFDPSSKPTSVACGPRLIRRDPRR